MNKITTTLFTLLIFLSILNVFGQESEHKHKRPVLSDITPEEMKEDIDYYFNTLEKTHANMYALISKDSLHSLKKHLYQDCSQSMKMVDFNRYLMRLNTVLDGHSGILFMYWDDVRGVTIYFPSAVKLEDGKLYLLSESMEDIGEIESINGLSASYIYNMTIKK